MPGVVHHRASAPAPVEASLYSLAKLLSPKAPARRALPGSADSKGLRPPAADPRAQPSKELNRKGLREEARCEGQHAVTNKKHHQPHSSDNSTCAPGKGSQPNFSFATNKFADSFSTGWSPRIALSLRTRSNFQLQDCVHVRFQPKRSASCRIGSSKGRFRSDMGSKRRPGSHPELPKSLQESSESLPETHSECRVALETSQQRKPLFYYHKSSEKEKSFTPCTIWPQAPGSVFREFPALIPFSSSRPPHAGP